MIRFITYTAIGALAYATYTGDVTSVDYVTAFNAATDFVAASIENVVAFNDAVIEAVNDPENPIVNGGF